MTDKNCGKIKTFPLIGLFIVILAILGIYTVNRLNKTETTSLPSFSMTKEGLPIYPSAEEMSNPIEGGEVRSFQLDPGTTPAELMTFYEKWLAENNWQLLVRDRDDGQIDALSQKEEKMRVWVYFTGSTEEDIGMTFFLNYVAPGGGSLPPIPVN